MVNSPLFPLPTFGQLTTGIVQHPATKLWQVWLCCNDAHIVWISAHQDEVEAEFVEQIVSDRHRQGKLQTAEQLGNLLAEVEAVTRLLPEPLSLEELQFGKVETIAPHNSNSNPLH